MRKRPGLEGSRGGRMAGPGRMKNEPEGSRREPEGAGGSRRKENAMRETGLEPARYYYHQALNLARLPIPPFPQRYELLISLSAGQLRSLRNQPSSPQAILKRFPRQSRTTVELPGGAMLAEHRVIRLATAASSGPGPEKSPVHSRGRATRQDPQRASSGRREARA